MTGVDLNEKRIAAARSSARKLGLENAEYELSNVLDWNASTTWDATYLLDLIHHLPQAAVPSLLAKLRELLRPGGILLVKNVSNRHRLKMLFTLLLDRLMVGMEPIRYWPPQELMTLLDDLGFDVKRHLMKDFVPYPHILYICRLSDRAASPIRDS